MLDLAKRLNELCSDATWSSVLGWVEEWQLLLGRPNVMSEEQQLGLWGELWLISKSTRPDSLLAAWRGPEADAIDFFLDGIGLEVKVSRQPHVHHVSQRQVAEPLGEHEAYLISLWIAPDPVRGTSLTQLVNALVAKVADPAFLLKRISELGYSPQHRDQYATRYLLLEYPLCFRARDVPRVRSVDPGVSQIRYVVSLDPDRCLNEEAAKPIWNLIYHSDHSASRNV
jgi:hypothetical protein